MKHKIQFLYYDYSERNLHVRLLLSNYGSKLENNPAVNYMYQLYVPQIQQFRNTQQSFQQFPDGEVIWNNIDIALLGMKSIDFTSRVKRLRFYVIPKHANITPEDIEEHNVRMDKFIQFLNKNIDSDKITISTSQECLHNNMPVIPTAAAATTNITTSSGSSPVSTAAAGVVATTGTESITGAIQSPKAPIAITSAVKKLKSRERSITRLWLSGPKNSNPRWLFVRYDEKITISDIFHLEFCWNCCDSWLIEDFINHLYRRTTSFGLRIIQTPEFFIADYFTLHPFRLQPFIEIQLPSISCIHGNNTCSQCIAKYSLQALVLLIENMLLISYFTIWIPDEPQKTKWEHTEESKSQISQLFANAHSTPNRRASDAIKKTNQVIPDRQYMHRCGFAAVRVAKNGFVWLLNGGPRVNEISNEEKKYDLNKSFSEFNEKCSLISYCYELVIETIENSFKIVGNSNNNNSTISSGSATSLG